MKLETRSCGRDQNELWSEWMLIPLLGVSGPFWDWGKSKAQSWIILVSHLGPTGISSCSVKASWSCQGRASSPVSSLIAGLGWPHPSRSRLEHFLKTYWWLLFTLWTHRTAQGWYVTQGPDSELAIALLLELLWVSPGQSLEDIIEPLSLEGPRPMQVWLE